MDPGALQARRVIPFQQLSAAFARAPPSAQVITGVAAAARATAARLENAAGMLPAAADWDMAMHEQLLLAKCLELHGAGAFRAVALMVSFAELSGVSSASVLKAGGRIPQRPVPAIAAGVARGSATSGGAPDSSWREHRTSGGAAAAVSVRCCAEKC